MRSGNPLIAALWRALARARRSLSVILALAALLATMPAGEEAQAAQFGRGSGNSVRATSVRPNSHFSATKRYNFNKGHSHKATGTGSYGEGKSGRYTGKSRGDHRYTGKDTGGSGKHTSKGKGKGKGKGEGTYPGKGERPGKVVDTYPDRPKGEGHRPHHPRRPHRPRHPHWPPVIVTNPAVPGIVVDGGGSGPPDTVIGTVSSGGGGGTPPSRPVTRRSGSGIPPTNERRYVPDEVVLELAPGITVQAAETIARRHGLVRLESFTSQLGGTTLVRWRIPDRRSVPAVVRALQADAAVISAQPNYLALLSQEARTPTTAGVGGPPQYALAKLQMPQAHALATGADVLIAVIDSGIDASHPELVGMIADSFDAIGTGDKIHAHGTGIAGAIVAHAKLLGTAPAARLLAIRAFGAKKDSGEGTTFNISKGLNWAVAHGARIINMSFAGPYDRAIERDLAAANDKGIVLVAAAGNAGPKSKPLYPAANPNVIAVTATDEDDELFSAANQGKHIAVAAPGVAIYLPAPGGIYQMTSGTSFAAAEVSGAVALMLQRKPDLPPQGVRKTLMSTARDLGPKGFDSRFGAGLVDAYKALISLDPAPIGTAKR